MEVNMASSGIKWISQNAQAEPFSVNLSGVK